MAVKRKSNWYIYLIALIISFVLLGIFVRSIWGSLFPATEDMGGSSSSSDFRPSESVKTTALLMLSDMKAGTPDYYMLVNYRPRDEVVVFVPLQENLRVSYKNSTGSLYEVYDNFGAPAVIDAIKETLGIECENYIKFDRLSFIDFIDLTGTVYVNVPTDITVTKTETFLETYIVKDEDGNETEATRTVTKEIESVLFEAGSNYYSGEQTYNYIAYDFGKGIDYQLAVQGSMAMNLVNRNFHDLSTTKMQRYFEEIIDSTDTNVSFSEYIKYQSAFQYTTQNTINPSAYYIPYGETDGGYFVISESSLETLKDRLEITTEKK